MACGTVATASPSPPAGGLTSDRAGAMAEPMAQSMSATPVVFVSAKPGQYRDFRGGGLATDANRWVWAVAFNGTFHSSGGPASAPGQTRSPLPDDHSVIVILDYRTGQFIQASISAPMPPD
jgi:hypothetical protein